ncbi:hypothetical protein [Hymenobacter nivis]|uniref:Phage major capsid protein n=1 Tax=Hymenobacter nivis TaxID=1850093 RepID=A0A502GYM6_9BACT|nr:hypothetical protein [Hymenobacter nivis]TPG66073.1 hypothetical protein EAH73_11935 [Hymenobacter nivis]
MNNLLETLMLDIRSNGIESLSRNESRPSMTGALDLFNKQTAGDNTILTPDLKAKLDASFGQVVKASVINYDNPTISNVRTCAVQVGGVTTKLVPFTFFTVAFGFPMVPAQYVNNDVGYETVFMRQLKDRIIKTQALLDTKCIDFANVNKNKFFPAEMLAYYSQVASAMQVPLQTDANGQQNWNGLFNFLQSILVQQDFTGSPDILTNPRGMADVRQRLSQGAQNAVNSAWEVPGTGNFFQSPRVLNSGPGVAATDYAILPGSVAITNRLDPDCLMADNYIGSKENPVSEWTKVPLPELGDYGLYYQSACSDQSAALAAQRLEGLTRTRIESFEWSADYCIFGAYNSDPITRYQPIQKFELLAA